MKRLNFALPITLLLILLATISGMLSNAINLPSSVKDKALPYLGLCLVLMILFTAIQYFQGQKSLLPSLPFELLQLSHVNTRGRLLQKVKRDWLDEYIERYVFTKQVLPVEVSHQPAAVEKSTPLNLTSSLPTSSLSLQNLHDLCHDGLLILGSPGAGKTIIVLEI